MRNRKKRTQREEVRKILHTMRLELAAQRLSQDNRPGKTQVLGISELFGHVRRNAS